MQDLVQALIVPFVSGFVVQRVLEVLDPLTTAKITNPNLKKLAIGIASLLIGWLIAGIVGIKIFADLKLACDPYVDMAFSGIFISAGTEGFNSLMKFANYKKEASKADAADKMSKLNASQLGVVNPQS